MSSKTWTVTDEEDSSVWAYRGPNPEDIAVQHAAEIGVWPEPEDIARCHALDGLDLSDISALYAGVIAGTYCPICGVVIDGPGVNASGRLVASPSEEFPEALVIEREPILYDGVLFCDRVCMEVMRSSGSEYASVSGMTGPRSHGNPESRPEPQMDPGPPF